MRVMCCFVARWWLCYWRMRRAFGGGARVSGSGLQRMGRHHEVAQRRGRIYVAAGALAVAVFESAHGRADGRGRCDEGNADDADGASDRLGYLGDADFCLYQRG